MSRTLIACLMVLAAAAVPAAAQSAYTSLAPEVITPDDMVIPAGGGVLVTYRLGPKDDLGREPTTQKTWRFVAKGVTSKPAITLLAPGLSVYAPRREGEVTLVDEQGMALVTFVRESATPAFGRVVPRVAVDVLISPPRPDDWGISYPGDGAAPAGAIGYVVYVVEGRRRRAIDWHMDDLAALPAPLPPGKRHPREGERVEIRWFDPGGRLSVASKPVRVGTAITCYPVDPCWPDEDGLPELVTP